MSKHQEILDYLENLRIGKRVSVRSISNHLNVSDGTAYRAIKEAENRGIVETRPRSGTVRVENKKKISLEKITFAEIARISDSEVVAGKDGLSQEFSKFSIGAMTRENILDHLVSGGLLIVGDREDIQLLALEHGNAILVTGGFAISEIVKDTADKLAIPVMVTAYDTFSVATLINKAISNAKIKTDIKTVGQIYLSKEDYGFLIETDLVSTYHDLVKETNHVRFPVIDSKNRVVGIVSMRDVIGKDQQLQIRKVMAKTPVTTSPNISLATVSQKMVFEDFDMLPVVDKSKNFLGVVTRRHVMETLKNLSKTHIHSYSEQFVSNLEVLKDGRVKFVVEPHMIDKSDSLAYGVLTEFLKEATMTLLTKRHQKNIIIEQMMVYFLQALQIDDFLTITPKVIAESRRSMTLDIDVTSAEQLVAKAIVTTKMT
ncbi:CBS-HotDog domain-containing transcription factor SpxR [Streptococcus pluranimalium]|uniref:CBS-HotDog domain-containing transcription factor SpxR n=1 Tax=Streptococcus pluranimalium TaxID=82348 RepID=UPI002A79468C|nr:CBS-HotDog domain-containing transcription factor SpxR [Streptococcus pluranimalium]